MVQGTFPLNKIVQYSFTVNWNKDGDDLSFYYYPDEKTQIKIQLDAVSIALLKQKRSQFDQFLSGEVTLSGTVVERWELQAVRKEAVVVDEWVQLA